MRNPVHSLNVNMGTFGEWPDHTPQRVPRP